MFEDMKITVTNLAAASHFGVKAAADSIKSDINRMRTEKKAFAGVLVASIMAVVIGSVMLYIGLFVGATVYAAIPSGKLSNADNDTLAGIKSNVNTAFSILGIIMIVGGAAGIISVLMGSFGAGLRQ